MSESSRREFLRRTTTAVAAGSVLGATGPILAADQPSATPPPSNEPTIPPHRAIPLDGVHCYTDELSVPLGGPVRFHVSSTMPYRLEVCRLGLDIDRPEGDEVLHTWDVDQPRAQPIHPGSYIHVGKGLDTTTPLAALTVELWVRLWKTSGRQCLISQLDLPESAGFGLFVTEGGSLGFHLGGRDDARETDLHWTEPAVLTRAAPAGEGRAALVPGRWQHVVATFDGRRKTLFVDGRQIAAWDGPARPQAADAPLRIGACGNDGVADELLDGDIAMPAVYARALSGDEVRARFERPIAPPPSDKKLLACWPLSEEQGDRVADSSGHGRHGVIINHATWMIGGPAFDADVPRYTSYAPSADPARGHGLRLASDDLVDCRWQPTCEFRLPATARSGLYVGRLRYRQDDEDRIYHTVFVVRPAAEGPKSPIALLFSTNTWKAYSATPFCPSWPGLWRSIGTMGFSTPRDDPKVAYSFYREHRGGQPTMHLGWRIPWPVASPYVGYLADELRYSHLTRADRWTQTWLERAGYAYDAYSQLDLAGDPHLLDGHRVLVFAGHSEYWSRAEMAAVERFLASGGQVICLSGNTMYWRVSHDDKARSIECRKIDAWGAMVRPEFRGEGWHSADRRMGGVPRDDGDPAWRVIGTEFMTSNPMDQRGVEPFRVTAPEHFLFNGPHKIEVAQGDTLAFDPAEPSQHAIGHESDVRVSTLMSLSAEPPVPTAPFDLHDPQGIDVLAAARFDLDIVKNAAARDYYHRVVEQDTLRKHDVSCEMIYWQRPDGGRVFSAPTIAAGRPLAADPRWSNLLKNVLHHFGVSPTPG